jgi:hypothetical protein
VCRREYSPVIYTGADRAARREKTSQDTDCTSLAVKWLGVQATLLFHIVEVLYGLGT